MTIPAFPIDSTQFRPGLLARPLGWLANRLAKPLARNPKLYSNLFQLDACQMHLVALAVVATTGEPSDHLITLLFTGPPKKIIAERFAHCVGLGRALRILPNAVLAREHYRSLVALLTDRPTGKYLNHRRSIDAPLISGLAALPSSLRFPAIFTLFDEIEDMDRFMDGLKVLSSRKGVELAAIVDDLSSLKQPGQIANRLIELIHELPLVEGLPKARIGPFLRLDSVSQINGLAKTWRNCLADYLHEVNECTGAVYVAPDLDSPAVAFAGRADRIGWVVHQIKGPRNQNLEPAQVKQYERLFRHVGLPTSSDVATLRNILSRTRWLRDCIV